MVFALTYVKQDIRKELYFGKTGSLEGQVMIILIIVSYIAVEGYKLLYARFVDEVSSYITLFLLFSRWTLMS